MNESWIKLYRKFLDSPLWKYALQANYPILISFWFYLLLSVNYEEKKWYDGKQEIIIPKGSLIISSIHLSEFFKVNRQTIRTCLKHLEKMKMLTSRTTNKWTQVWIVNWSKYQSKDYDTNQPTNHSLTNDKPTANQRLTTTKEYKNVRNKELRIYMSLDYLLKIPDQDLKEITKKYNTTPEFIKSKADDLLNYCKAHGKIYKDYRALLLNAVKRDAPKKMEVINL